jgi:catechol 2,3-dioxygenase-like lactoylglutathione lyase family enzyme
VFSLHHVSISVRDLDATLAFYGRLGFQPHARMDAVDVSIVHLRDADGAVIEVFRYPENADARAVDLEPGNAMRIVGVKHLAVRVRDLQAARTQLLHEGLTVTEITQGRIGVSYCWVADPDGMWVELVEDAP